MTKKRYVLFPAERTTCPRCGQQPQLLATKDFDVALPAFYVCRCGFIGQIGVGPVEERKDESHEHQA